MAETNNSTWQARNPNHPVIPSYVLKKNKISNAEQASCQTTAEQCATKHEALQVDINLYLEEQKHRLETIATTHDVMVKYMDCLVTLQTYYHTTCKPHLANVLIHTKVKEVNSVRELLANDLKMQLENLTKEQKEYYIQELVKQRDLMAHGVHANNIAAGEDVFSLENLRDCTGIYASLFVTCGHINDSTQASWFGMDNSTVFWEDVLGHSTGDVACLYEQWACTQGHTIVKMYGVKLLGWPTGVPFVNPSSIGTVSEICKLRNSLKSGECRWKKLSKAECNAFSSKLEACCASGEVVKKPCKKCSDVGVPHKQKNVLGDDDQEDGSEEDID
ncbi:hypothetical protein BKA83DRAFT_4464850 [Pisolithus microcarpus]|nr:hypothetical protein BKA83DRAFT_4464850 [Pisolithus microcarpus]